MNKQDIIVGFAIIFTIVLFISNPLLLESYFVFNKQHGMITSFLKFGILATFGEMLALRIKNGNYYQKEFGLIPKFLVWGFIGLTIKLAFITFTSGTIEFLNYLGMSNALETFKNGDIKHKISIAFAISVSINIIYAPVMMTFHKITDIHIEKHKGKLKSLGIPINFTASFLKIDWNIQWNFIFKKTIPLFWIPMHTITFMLPSEFQVLFAALLSIMLGLILSLATLKSQN